MTRSKRRIPGKSRKSYTPTKAAPRNWIIPFKKNLSSFQSLPLPKPLQQLFPPERIKSNLDRLCQPGLLAPSFMAYEFKKWLISLNNFSGSHFRLTAFGLLASPPTDQAGKKRKRQGVFIGKATLLPITQRIRSGRPVWLCLVGPARRPANQPTIDRIVGPGSGKKKWVKGRWLEVGKVFRFHQGLD